jgi:peptidyl-prolyl cis-trans isomerase C
MATTTEPLTALDEATELLRLAAIREGLLDAGDPPAAQGVISEAASRAIEALLDRAIRVPEPSEEACRRHHAAHAARYTRGERVALRHVLFAVTPGVDVVALRKRAEACLLDVRCHDGTGADRFAQSACELSNCPSGAQGGDLGWLEASDCAPEFAREVFGHPEVGVLPRLVHSRFGLHVVEVLQREPGEALPFEAVRGAVEASLRQQAYATALRQYLQLLGGAETPLVQ